MTGMPEGWVEVALGEVVEPKETRNPRTDGSKSFRYVDVQAVDNARNRVGVAAELPSQSAPSRARRLVRTDDVLFCLVRPYLRNIALVPRELDGQVASTAFCVLRPNGALASRFLFHQVLRDSFIGEVPTYGTSPPAAREDEFLKQRIRLAPLPEQHRIVARIESLFAALDEGVSALTRADANLERYRASVLKAAVEGKLTERWRNENPIEETGEELLARILAVRRLRWEEEQLAKYAAKGRQPPKNWRTKYKEPVAPDTGKLQKLPLGWCWATVDQVGEVVTGTTPATADSANYGEHLPFFKPTDLDAGYHTRDARQYLSEIGASLSRRLPPMAVLVTCIGATIGKAGLARVSCATNQQINALVPILREEMGPYLFWYFASPLGQREIVGRSSATTLPILNKGRFSELPVPIAPLAEQAAVAQRLDVVRSAYEMLSATLTIGRQRAAALGQSNLKRAFEGRLVPQDPDDEPASFLLERIRAERETEAKKKRK